MKTIINTFRTSGAVLLMLALTFIGLEPTIGSAIEDQFTVTQIVTSEISFLTPATDITMSPQLAGITGGTSNGSTQVVVHTNNSTGYTMTLTASSSSGMIGNSEGGNIPAYTPASAGVPDRLFSVATNKAEFGYTVEASTTADLDQSFLDDGSNCNTGSADVADQCWLNSSTVAETIVNRTSETLASGATTTIKFRVTINSNPVPSIPEDTYVSTTTLTATAN